MVAPLVQEKCLTCHGGGEVVIAGTTTMFGPGQDKWEVCPHCRGTGGEWRDMTTEERLDYLEEELQKLKAIVGDGEDHD